VINFLFGFKGRINRAKMWLIYLLSCIALGVPMSVWLPVWEEALIGANPRPTVLSPVVNWALWLWVAVVFYVMIAAVVKRFHDRGKSAAWLAYFFIAPITFFAAAYFVGWPPRPIFPGAAVIMYVFFVFVFLNNIWYLLEVLALPGTKGDNRFGPDPRAKSP
jgi:uncharacterized membrane protein YhaH (DUF805 family)